MSRPLPARAKERQREDGELKGGMDVHAPRWSETSII
jgi:hypothetical protein